MRSMRVRTPWQLPNSNPIEHLAYRPRKHKLHSHPHLLPVLPWLDYLVGISTRAQYRFLDPHWRDRPMSVTYSHVSEF